MWAVAEVPLEVESLMKKLSFEAELHPIDEGAGLNKKSGMIGDRDQSVWIPPLLDH